MPKGKENNILIARIIFGFLGACLMVVLVYIDTPEREVNNIVYGTFAMFILWLVFWAENVVDLYKSYKWLRDKE